MTDKELFEFLDELEKMSVAHHEKGVKATVDLEGETNPRRSLALLKDLNQAIGAQRAIHEITLIMSHKNFHKECIDNINDFIKNVNMEN